MHLYWTHKSFPELRDLESTRRKTVWRACCLRPSQHWQTWAAFLSQFIIVLAGAIVGLFFDGQTWLLFDSSSPEIAAMRFPFATVGLASFAGIGSSFWFGQVYSRMIRPYLKKYAESYQAAWRRC